MRELGYLVLSGLLFLCLLTGVAGFYLFYEAGTALSQVQAQLSSLAKIPAVGWLFAGMGSSALADQISQLQRLRSLGLVSGLSGVAATVGASVLLMALAAAGRKGGSSQAVPLGVRRGRGLHVWRVALPNGNIHTVEFDAGTFKGTLILDGDILTKGYFEKDFHFTIEDEPAHITSISSLKDQWLLKLYVAGQLIE